MVNTAGTVLLKLLFCVVKIVEYIKAKRLQISNDVLPTEVKITDADQNKIKNQELFELELSSDF